MKKSSKPTIYLILTLLLIVTMFTLINIGVKLKLEQSLFLQKDNAEKILKSESQRKNKLTAEYQTVTAEERIVAVAKSELGLIRSGESPFIINYNRSRIEEINEVLKEKYE